VYIEASIVVSRLTSDNTILATFVTFDVIWRFPTRLVGNLPDWVAPALSIGAGFSGNAVLASVSTWLLFGVMFYIFADRIYPERLQLPTDDEKFRTLIAVIGLATGLGLWLSDSMGALAVVLSSLSSLGVISLLLYLHYIEEWPLFKADGPIVGPMQLIDDDAPAEYEQMLASDSWVMSVNIGFFLVATGAIVVLPCLLLGVLAQTFVRAYPLPDLFILAVMIGNVIERTHIIGSRSLFPATKTIDFEARLHAGLDTATQSLKALFLTIYVLFGTFIGGGILGIAVTYGTAAFRPEYLSQAAFSRLLDAPLDLLLPLWGIIGVFVLLVLAGTHGFWLWLREFKRLSEYVEYRKNGTETVDRVRPARPAGMTLPPTILLLILGLYITTSAHSVFAVIWPLAIFGTGLCIWLTRRRIATRIRYEDHVIVGSFLIYMAALPLTLAGETIVTMATQLQFPVGSIIRSPAPVIGALLIGAPYFGNASQYAEQFDDARRHVDGVYLAVFGIIVWLASRPAGQGFEIVGVATLLVTSVAAVLGVAFGELTGHRRRV
jgi:hypothetical protein